MTLADAIQSGKRHRRKSRAGLGWHPACKRSATSLAFSPIEEDGELVDYDSQVALAGIVYLIGYQPNDVLADDWEVEGDNHKKWSGD